MRFSTVCSPLTLQPSDKRVSNILEGADAAGRRFSGYSEYI